LNSFEWDVTKQQFVAVEDPTHNPDVDDVETSIRAAGYAREFSSQDGDSMGATFRVYRSIDEGKPAFYIDIMGESTGIATLIARDFPHLVATLQQLQPFMALVRLDQVSWIESAKQG
jgi:hypothetical protein